MTLGRTFFYEKKSKVKITGAHLAPAIAVEALVSGAGGAFAGSQLSNDAHLEKKDFVYQGIGAGLLFSLALIGMDLFFYWLLYGG